MGLPCFHQDGNHPDVDVRLVVFEIAVDLLLLWGLIVAATSPLGFVD